MHIVYQFNAGDCVRMIGLSGRLSAGSSGTIHSVFSAGSMLDKLWPAIVRW